MASKLKYFRSPEAVILFVRVFLCMVVVRILLRLVKIQRLLELLDSGNRKTLEEYWLDHVHRFTNFFVYDLFRSKNPCLHRSLVLFRYFRMMGMDVQIVFAVRKSSGDLEGHAWLEYKGCPFLAHGGASDVYDTFMKYPE